MAIFNLKETDAPIIPDLSSKLSPNQPVGSIYDIITEIKKYGNFDSYKGLFKTKSNNINRLIIYRHEDLDGAASAASILRFFHYDDVKVVEIKCDYEMIFDMEVTERDEVWFVDYSFSNEKNLEYLRHILKITPNVVWIDHHESSVKIVRENDDLKSINGIVQDFKLSGAMLTYLYLYILQFYKEDSIDIKIPDIIQYVSDYDTFSMKKPNTKQFFIGISLLDYNRQVVVNNELHPTWKMLFDVENMYSFIEKGKLIDLYLTMTDKTHINGYAFETDFFEQYTDKDISVLAINRKGNSFMFDNNYDAYDIVCSFYYDGKINKYFYSLYSDEAKAKEKGYSCEDIASKLGGGGHIGAAGFTSDKNIFEK